MVKAEIDLPWFFGTGPTTAAGDMGLRSSLGPQLDAARSGIDRDHVAVDSSRSEDAMIGSLGAAGRYGEIEARLRALPAEDVEILRAHYSERPLPYGLTACAVIVERQSRERLSVLLRTGEAGRLLARSIELRAIPVLARARAAYEAADVPRRRRAKA